MSENTAQRPGTSLADLVEIMNRLLAPDGCAWDREQTLDSLRPFLLEETYEVLDAMERGTPEEHCEELGDLAMQIVFHAALHQSKGNFGIDDVCRGICEKLIRRHPHIFSDATADTADDVLVQWEQIKAAEKAARGGTSGPARVLAGVPIALPPLARAQKLGRRAAKVGFDWPDLNTSATSTIAGPRAKVDEELAEFDEAVASGDREAMEAELGDVLLAVVNVARKLKLDADTALRGANNRFEARFQYIEDALHPQGRTPKDCDLAELETLWQQAKVQLKGGDSA